MLMQWTTLAPWSQPQMEREIRTIRRHLDDIPLFPPRWASPEPSPEMSFEDEGDALVLTAELPGVRDRDLEVEITGNRLTVSGRRETAVPEKSQIRRRERAPLRFARVFELPCRVEPDGADARLERGILTLRLPKAAEAQRQVIKVRAAS